MPVREMIGIKCCCRAAWAQLERHYEIAIMMHHLACCISALTGEVSPVQCAFIPTSPCRVGPRQRTKKRGLCVGATYYSEGRPTAKIGSLPLSLEKNADTRLIIVPLLFVNGSF